MGLNWWEECSKARLFRFFLACVIFLPSMYRAGHLAHEGLQGESRVTFLGFRSWGEENSSFYGLLQEKASREKGRETFLLLWSSQFPLAYNLSMPRCHILGYYIPIPNTWDSFLGRTSGRESTVTQSSTNIYLLSIYYVPGPVLAAGDTAVNKTKSQPLGAYILVR